MVARVDVDTLPAFDNGLAEQRSAELDAFTIARKHKPRATIARQPCACLSDEYYQKSRRQCQQPTPAAAR
jgi:hypothetical protein